MRGVNLIAVFNKDCDKVLMCKRRKEPYKGLYNFVGGKIEEGEKGIDAAYRELSEETGIGKEDVSLRHFMDLTYYFHEFYMEVYVGILNKNVIVHGEENELCWMERYENFADETKFAGKGNIAHIMNMLEF